MYGWVCTGVLRHWHEENWHNESDLIKAHGTPYIAIKNSMTEIISSSQSNLKLAMPMTIRLELTSNQLTSLNNGYLIICKLNKNCEKKKKPNDINKNKAKMLYFHFNCIEIIDFLRRPNHTNTTNDHIWYGQLVFCLQEIAILWFIMWCVSNSV